MLVKIKMKKKIKLFLLFLIILCIIIYIFIVKSTFSNSKQKTYIVSFAHNCCVEAQKNLEKTAKEFGVDYVFSLNLESLEAPEEVKKYISDNKRGAGYWIWKPYAMKQILKISNPGDIIIYVDSSTYFNKSINNIIDFINNNSILCFKHGEIGKEEDTRQFKWTKMNAVEYFGYSADSWCKNEGQKSQFMGAFIGILNNQIGNSLINKYLEIMNPKFSYLFDDSPSNIENCDGFKESRHDQQMLSLILYKYFPDILFPDYDKNKYGWVWHEPINGNNRHL